MSMPKKVLIALPPAMLEQVDFIAQCEHRTRSDLIREALRRYLDNFKRTNSNLHMIDTTPPAPVQSTQKEEKPEPTAPIPFFNRPPSLRD